MLVIQLKRFKMGDDGARFSEKNEARVGIPLQLDMSIYAKNSHHNSKENLNYILFAISHHEGQLNGGHYWSEVNPR